MKSRGAAVLVIVAMTGIVVTGATLLAQSRRSDQRFSFPVELSCGPAHARGEVVRVELSDDGTMMGGVTPMGVSLSATPASVKSGTITFEATNVGHLPHELVVMPAPTTGVGTRRVNANGKIDETGSLGEASASCRAGAGSGIGPGATGWVTMNLRPGLYELVCDVPWHYVQGMVSALRVT